MTRIVSIFIATLAATFALPQSALAGAAVPVSISINRHPEPKRRINWSAVHAASKQIDVAKGQLRLAAKDARRTVEATSAYETAVVNLRAAQAQHQLAVAQATSALELSPEYIQLDLQLQSAVATVDTLHRRSRTNQKKVMTAAADVMRIRAQLTALRKLALAADMNVDDARYALVDAGAELRRLREDAKSRVLQSPSWQSARQQLDAARRQFATAG